MTIDEAQAGPLAEWLGREHGLEDLVAQVVRDSAAGILHHQPGDMVVRGQRDGDPAVAGLGQGVERVGHEVGHDLGEAAGRAQELDRLLRSVEAHASRGAPAVVAEQEQRFLDDRDGIEAHLLLRGEIAGLGLDAADEAGGTLRGAPRQPDRGSHLGGDLEVVLAGHLVVADRVLVLQRPLVDLEERRPNRREWRVHLVGDVGGDPPEGRHLLGTQQPLLVVLERAVRILQLGRRGP